MRDSSLLERRDDQLGLCLRHDHVVGSLQDEHGRGDLLDEVDRAAGAVQLRRLRVRPDQRVLVLELELVRVAGAELLEVGDSEVRASGRELVRERQRADGRVPARASTGDQQPVGIGFSLVHEKASRIDAVLQVDDAPLAVQPLAVGASVAGRSSVVDVDDGETSTRPELRVQAEHRARARRRAAVAHHDQRRQLAFGRGVLGAHGRVEERMGGEVVLGRELDRTRQGEVRRRPRAPGRSVVASPSLRSRRRAGRSRSGSWPSRPRRPRSSLPRPRTGSTARRTAARDPRACPSRDRAARTSFGRAGRRRRRSDRRPGMRTSATRRPMRDSRTRPPPRTARSAHRRARVRGSTSRCDRSRTRARRPGSTRAARSTPPRRARQPA